MLDTTNRSFRTTKQFNQSKIFTIRISSIINRCISKYKTFNSRFHFNKCNNLFHSKIYKPKISPKSNLLINKASNRIKVLWSQKLMKAMDKNNVAANVFAVLDLLFHRKINKVPKYLNRIIIQNTKRIYQPPFK